jgi:hypothetical protein
MASGIVTGTLKLDRENTIGGRSSTIGRIGGKMSLHNTAIRVLALSAACAGCGASPAAPTTPFTLSAGAYTLIITGGSNGGSSPVFCSVSGVTASEGRFPVDVTQSGTRWTVTPAGAANLGLTMSFSTSGAAVGGVIGESTGSARDASTDVKITITNAGLEGTNGSGTIAGGALRGSVKFEMPAGAPVGGTSTCTEGRWTLQLGQARPS